MPRFALTLAACSVVAAAAASLKPLPAPRSDFLVPPGWTYHNVATLGPSPKAVVTAVQDAVAELEVDPTNQYFGGNGVAHPATTRMEAVRQQAATALGAFLNETVITPLFLSFSLSLSVCPQLINSHANR